MRRKRRLGIGSNEKLSRSIGIVLAVLVSIVLSTGRSVGGAIGQGESTRDSSAIVYDEQAQHSADSPSGLIRDDEFYSGGAEGDPGDDEPAPAPYPTPPPRFPCGPNAIENQAWGGAFASGPLGMLAGLIQPACAKAFRRPPSRVVCKPLLTMDTEEAAVLSDTLEDLSTPYPNILARSAYYDVVDRLFNDNRGTVGIRFFEAAHLVTNPTQAGSIEWPHGFLTNNADARHVLEFINAELFRHNIQIIARVARFGCPLDPLITPRNVKIDPMTFDLNMVLSEQRFVEQELIQFQTDPRYMALANLALAIPDINHDINLDSWWDVRWLGNFAGFLGIDRTAINWARDVLGGPIDFMRYPDRVAIGRALIFKLHGKSPPEFRNFWMQTQTLAVIGNY